MRRLADPKAAYVKASRSKTEPGNTEAGFTILEMMVTSALLLIVLAMILPLVANSLNLFTSTSVRSDAVDNSQLAFSQISHDVVSSNVLYLDSSGLVHLQTYGRTGASTCVEYQVQYPAAAQPQLGTMQRRTKTPGSSAWSAGWSTIMTGIVNSSQPIMAPAVTTPAVFTIPASSQYKSLVVNLYVQVDTRTASVAAAPENYTSTFTGPAIPANAGATSTPSSEPC